jgi:hypothetical protein
LAWRLAVAENSFAYASGEGWRGGSPLAENNKEPA